LLLIFRMYQQIKRNTNIPVSLAYHLIVYFLKYLQKNLMDLMKNKGLQQEGLK
jgi:hypothetical protein